MFTRARILIAAALLVGSAAWPASAQSVVFVVRHAERADAGRRGAAMRPGSSMSRLPADPPLSSAGHARAVKLAALLRSERIRTIFATEFKRTQQTAAPTANEDHLTIETLPAKDVSGLLAKLRDARGPVLVVGHGDTVPKILEGLGVEAVTIGDNEYDNLFVVVRPATGKPMLVRLRY